MKIPCICIDDTGRPESIPQSKWVKKDEKYHVIHIYVHPLQGGCKGVELYEKPLGEDCAPYVAFRLSRFMFNIDDVPKLIELANLCSEMDNVEIEELLYDEGLVVSK